MFFARFYFPLLTPDRCCTIVLYFYPREGVNSCVPSSSTTMRCSGAGSFSGDLLKIKKTRLQEGVFGAQSSRIPSTTPSLSDIVHSYEVRLPSFPPLSFFSLSAQLCTSRPCLPKESKFCSDRGCGVCRCSDVKEMPDVSCCACRNPLVQNLPEPRVRG